MSTPVFRSAFTGFIAAWLSAGAMVSPALAQTPSPAAPTPAGTASPQPQTLQDRTQQIWQERQISLILLGLALGGYLGVLWIKPLLLLKLPSTDIAVPWTTWKLPLGVVRRLKYRSRVLDAWVERHWQEAEQAFLNLPTVKDRDIHISLPVKLNKEPINDLQRQHLISTFQKNTAVLLISSEGGSGKTSLACQIARYGLEKQLTSHRMLPALVETELDNEKTLLEAIRGQLNDLTNQSEAMSVELLKELLRRQRVLVIVDHLSEMSEITRKQVKPDLAEFPAKALIVTSRLQEPLGSVTKSVLTPLRIEADRLIPFMTTYLECRNKRNEFVDDEFVNAYRRLSEMVGQRNITVLLARLYIDQLIRQKDGEGGTLPSSVPDLMRQYVNELNGSIEPAIKRDDLQVQQEAKVIAWECVRQTYQPTPAKKADVFKALDALDGKVSSKDRYMYLEERLQLVKTLQPGDRVRLVLDPLAEYLAAIYWVEACAEHDDCEKRWREFLASIDQRQAELEKFQPDKFQESMQGFLLAVRDCCLVNYKAAHVPEFVPDALAEKAGLNPTHLRQKQEERRIRLLISELSAPEEEYRIRAAQDLAKRGKSAARMAAPNLIGMLENPNQTTEARQAAAQTLGALNIGRDVLIKLLENTEEDSRVRRSAAEALGAMKTGNSALLSILQSDTQPLTTRQGAARALRLIGAPSGEPLSMLIVEVRAGQAQTQVKSIPVWQEPLPEGLSLDLVAIPGGEFLMGSPPEEAGRDILHKYYSETIGLDVEAQHRVTVSAFGMGQYPVTQAQWRVVAAMPKINQDLDPDPSSFKGDDRPVETVSWHDAVEFCDRLSQYTGKPYRLPSEAEWEYACRAGTTGPFHLGDTLSTDLANYDGNAVYGNGRTGEYRQQTTEVGSFGVVNAFGLADMHGNVREWCLDTWHPSYEGSPTDGSAWVDENDNRYRLVRGGSWSYIPEVCRSAIRYRYTPVGRNDDDGVRVVCIASWTL